MIDWNKPVRTKDGREVRVLCTDRSSPSGYPVLALIKDGHGGEVVYTYTIEGKYYRSGMLDLNDLENVPEVHHRYLNVSSWIGWASAGEVKDRLIKYNRPNDKIMRLTFVDGVVVSGEILDDKD